jgi:hypothetical protein
MSHLERVAPSIPNGVHQSFRRFERRFYLGTSILFLALVGWTFARTYYLRPLFGGAPLPVLLHVHGAVMTGWVVLLVVQSGLIAGRQVRWHRRLGVVGTVWAGMVVLLGTTTTIHAAAREVRAHTAAASSQVTIMGLEVVQMVLFAAFVATAIVRRRRVDVHKRLMLLTIACMLPSAIGRLPVSFMTNGLIMAGLYVFVLACVGIDTLRHRRLHPAFGWGALAVLGGLQVAFYFTRAATWIALGTRWVS